MNVLFVFYCSSYPETSSRLFNRFDLVCLLALVLLKATEYLEWIFGKINI